MKTPTPSAGGSYVATGGKLKRIEGTEPAPGPGEAPPPATGHAVAETAPRDGDRGADEAPIAAAKPAGKRQVKGGDNA